MDLITDKALKAFKAYIKKENGWTSQDFTEHYKCQGNDKYTCADIIDWLDSVGIYIYIEPSIPIGYEKPDCFLFRVNNETNRMKFTTRHQATQSAIKKAVEIFNSRP